MRSSIIALVLLTPFVVSASSIGPARIKMLQSPDSRACEMFLLDSGGPWYGISTSNSGYKEAVASLIAAKIANREIQFDTMSGADCGGDTSVVVVSRILML